MTTSRREYARNFLKDTIRLEIDFSRHIVKLDGEIVDLTTNEFAALALLTENPGKVLTGTRYYRNCGGSTVMPLTGLWILP